jgi:transcription factor C subunit 6
MPRELRSRKSRPNYALLSIGDEDQAGSSVNATAAVVDEDVDSGSDFAPEAEETGQVDMDVDDQEVGDPEEEEEEPIVNKPRKSSSTPKTTAPERKTKPLPARGRSSVPPKARANKGHNYSLPQPHVNHRHRAIPLYQRDAQVERLETAPAFFKPGATTLTNSFTSSPELTMRLGRGWSANVGSGPLWQLLEDRGWYKEALLDANEASESKRRPRVHAALQTTENISLISKE